MTIRFYRMTDDGTATIGDMILRNGQIVLDPPDQPTLQQMLDEPHAEPNFETGQPITFDPINDPVPFLKSCVRVFRGSYFWCKELPASTETESAASHRDTQEG
jgi:hypothetical protein